jgi:hypothetical protein
MKKLLYLGIVLMFASCGDTESESESSTVNFARREVSTIKIDNLEVMTEDLEGNYTWDDAMKACADLGDGWRLPTKDELNLLYENKEKIGGFADIYYWSSTEYGNGLGAWHQFFYNGNQYFTNKDFGASYVRAVRAF